MDEIARLADRVTVLRDGRLVTSAPAAELPRDEIVRLMVGRAVEDVYPVATSSPGDTVVRLDGVSSGPVRDATLALRRGEIVGLVGLVGAGRTELARALFGAAPVTAGTMTLDGHAYRPRAPRDAIAAGIGLLPEDRKAQGLILAAAIRENASLAALPTFARGGVVELVRERAAVSEWADRLRLRAPSLEKPARQLSGGNQQKVVLARWMIANSRVLLFDEPTRGIDVGARAEIYALMRRLADEGAAVLMISSDLPEALGMADRVVAMRAGRIVGELARAEASPDRVASLILGEHRAGAAA
jgi:ABC-type sugar transport system ATPase subunit